ncbi:sphingolipid delta(4)-desaturase DES1-like [Symsagittifera roscoffensis]|uniref:sphingolipid delta(4)-desaturase DES1-like n=1 Tax=Symsagittifera roscoffensis TaxID=84072 RepID=UPI00307B9923
MGAKCTRSEFEYTYSDEPHSTRRKQILAKYPEVRQLYGNDYTMLAMMPFIVAFQTWMSWVVGRSSWPITIAFSYVISGTINQSLMLAVHENSHNTVFGSRRQLWTRLFGIFMNLPIGVPIYVSFKKYHGDHHTFLGHHEKDRDLPHPLEAKLFNRPITKILWLILNPLLYTLRPTLVYPKPFVWWELINLIVQLLYDYFVFSYLGGIKAIFYLVGGSILGSGLHPMAGHFISEHYIFFDKGQQTSSYYGPMNYLAWNVGYHNEHHDFPWISFRKLPKLTKIAPEFYKDLPHHTSWVGCLIKFIFDPEVGPFARVKNAASVDRAKDS